MKIVIRHAYYGCDSGCCGTIPRVVFDDGTEIEGDFDFMHCMSVQDARDVAVGLFTDIPDDAPIVVENSLGEVVGDFDWHKAYWDCW